VQPLGRRPVRHQLPAVAAGPAEPKRRPAGQLGEGTAIGQLVSQRARPSQARCGLADERSSRTNGTQRSVGRRMGRECRHQDRPNTSTPLHL
jgi:hypothetical protein